MARIVLGVALLFGLTVAFGCASAETREAVRRGVADATREIAAGNPHLLFIGLPAFDRDVIDPGSGLPAWSCGCVYSDTQAAYVDAFNGTMAAALADGRLAGFSLAHKITTHAAVAARFAEEAPTLLAFQGDPLVSPGGRFTLRYAPYSDHPDAVRFIYVTDTETGRERRTISPETDAVPVLFDHDGTTLLVRDDPLQCFVTFDLPRAIEMQILVDPGR